MSLSKRINTLSEIYSKKVKIKLVNLNVSLRDLTNFPIIAIAFSPPKN